MTKHEESWNEKTLMSLLLYEELELQLQHFGIAQA